MTKEIRLAALHRQVRRLDRRLERLHRTSYRYSWIRIVVLVSGLLATGLALHFAGGWLAGNCAAATALLFGLVVFFHRRLDESIARHQGWREIKAAHAARASLDWEHIRSAFPHQPQPDHPFESDLDLIGPRSLHHLLDTAVSFEGSQRLREWLTATTPDAEQIAQRQQRVRELAPRSLFRDRLTLHATLAAGAKRTWRASQLVSWLAGHTPEKSLRRWLVLSAMLAALNAALLIAHQLGPMPAWWRVSWVVYLGIWLAGSRAAGAPAVEALALQGALGQLRAVFRHLETYSYQGTPHLRALCEPFLDPAHRPSRYLARITRIVAAVGLGQNPLVRFALNAVVPWDFYVAYRLSCYKSDLAERAPAWMDAWFELEALSSLANLAYLNPSYAFPDLLVAVDRAQPFVFKVEGLGHPLLTDAERVCNDLLVPELGWVAMITGSNMAGKSVFLKTVGVNLVLAYAGGPVNAVRLETVLFRLFTSMRVADSVTDGISYFYAEVKRLKALLMALEGDHELPLLFCIDEIFRGTNNRERLIGSRAYVRALAGKHGVGLIATHDLELTNLADGIPWVQNYHFRDRVEGDRLVFDYRLRPGPCPTTNALRIMQLEGLPAGK
jgi:hypothetical protein